MTRSSATTRASTRKIDFLDSSEDELEGGDGSEAEAEVEGIDAMEGMVVGRADNENVATLVLTLQLLELYDGLIWPSKQIDAIALITANNVSV